MFFVCQKLLKSTIQSSSPESFQLIQEKNDLNLRGCIAVAFSIASRCFVIANSVSVLVSKHRTVDGLTLTLRCDIIQALMCVTLASRVLNLPIHLWPTIKCNNAHVWIGQGCQVLEIEWGKNSHRIMFLRQWFNSQCKLRTQGMENNSISNKNHKYAVWLRCLLLWKEKAISIFPDLEKKNLSGKLCPYIKDFMRLSSYKEALEWKHNPS